MALKGYLIKRIALSIFILWVVITLNFVIFRVVHPIENPASLFLNPDWPVEVRELLEEKWGVNEPLFPNQYAKYIWNLLTWQYGYSFSLPPEPIGPEMAWRLKNTLILLGTAMVLTIAIGLPLGVLAGANRGKKSDITVMGFGLFTWGFPTFFFQLLFILFFAYYANLYLGYRIIPYGGMVSYPPPGDPFSYTADVMWHAIGPISTLVILGFGGWALYTRNLIIDTLTEDYILTARAKGVKRRQVLYKHALRSVLPPIVTIIAMGIPGLVTGAVMTESIFGWPGIGGWYISSLNNGNHPVTQAVLYNFAFLMILANLVSDVLYGFLDPRIKVGARR